jgi:hypothetical protein
MDSATNNNEDASDLETPQDRLIDTLLRETLGRQAPPNLVGRIMTKVALARRRFYWMSGSLSAAAAILIGLAAWRFAAPQKPAELAKNAEVNENEFNWTHLGNTPTEPRFDLTASPRAPAQAVQAPQSEWAYGQSIRIDQQRTLDVGGYCHVDAAANSVLTREGKEKAEQVFLETGRVTCEVNRHVGTFAVRTDSGTVSVTGTKFTVTLTGEGNNETGERIRKKQLAVSVEAGSVELTGFGAKLLKGESGGVAFGTVTNKEENFIEIRDGDGKPQRFTPRVKDGLDREVLEQIASIPKYARVQVAWVNHEFPRAIKFNVLWKPDQHGVREDRPKQHGVIVGVIVEKGEDGIRVKESNGESERYIPRWRDGDGGEKGGPDKETLRALEKFKQGDKVKIEWIMQEERRRIVRIDKLEARGEKDKGEKVEKEKEREKQSKE